VLGYLISERGIEVDRAKIEVIEQLPPPINIKGIRSFLGHAGFYRRFIKNFSHIARPLTNLLAKDVPFEFDDACLKAFETLKKALTSAPIIQPPDWSLPFEIIQSTEPGRDGHQVRHRGLTTRFGRWLSPKRARLSERCI
jgi:hypothetical protein